MSDMSEVRILRGKPVADAIKGTVSARVKALKARGVEPTLAILRVGERQDDLAYESSLLKSANTLGINVNVFAQAESISNDELLGLVDDINEDESIHGCLIFRPLPQGIDEAALCDRLQVHKDVDGCSAASLAGVFMDTADGFAPATAQACIEMLDFYGIDLLGKEVVVVGRSLVIGKPVAMLALKRNATISIGHSKTEDLKALTRRGDIVICAVGKAKYFDDSFFSAGQTIIDVGMNVDDEGSLCGDVDFERVSALVENITPVPSGVGSVTTAVLLEQVVSACERACRV